MSKRYCIVTLGCKVNQCESAAIGQKFDQHGWRAASTETADICIVNTCAVTQKAAMQSRQAIRRAARANPRAQIMVTGCYAQINPEQLAAIDGVAKVVGNTAKHMISELAIDHGALRADQSRIIRGDISCCHHFAFLPASTPESRTRAFLKIQDGCNSFCTYCIVPYARGPSRSMLADQVISNLLILEQQGVQEVVLTGIHLGQYGRDLGQNICLEFLLDKIRNRAPVQRLRLSSIEPTEVTPGLIARINEYCSGKSRLCNHLHIPLQSGDDLILKRMRRPYDRKFFQKIITQIRKRLPEASIGVDVLVGFPGENDQAFENTFNLLKDLPISYLHVFPFSARPGTPAWHFKNKIPSKLVKERCRLLRRLSESKKHAFYKSMIGKNMEVLIEAEADKTTSLPRGLSNNYIQVSIKTDRTIASNSFVQVKVDEVAPDLTVIGKPVYYQ